MVKWQGGDKKPTKDQLAKQREEKYMASLASIDDLRRSIAMLLHSDNDEDVIAILREKMKNDPELKKWFLDKFIERMRREDESDG